ncbi:hypothetical protein LUZ61_016649 [Rhynchospora tenuis]|uniref:Late embryogenesis abundant protein LEA-2 subgroup domain-containing protein n=1 Tax=Rhynchospora tenuis TaxID=198213 RepID=A0AAD5Z5Y6_9POAL|nr:hypothetical protein LUZ61_016649 [Rhynchospora tenuis]
MADTPESSHKVHDDEDSDGDLKAGGREGNGRIIVFAILSLLLLAGIITLVLYLVYRPSHPHFTVVSVAIVSLSNSSSLFNTITAAVQPTLVIRNPNSRASIRYDRIEMYVTYHNAPITAPMLLPPLIQDKDTSVAISPVLGGPAVPVSPDVVEGLAVDRSFGVVPLRLIAVGRIRYNPGPFRGRWSSLYVRCNMLVAARTGVAGPVPLLANSDCSVD